MTTPAFGSGRPFAIHRPRGFINSIVAGLLVVASAPSIAADVGDPLDVSPQLLAPLADTGLHNPLALPGRSVMFASDMRAIFNDAPVAVDTVPERAGAPQDGRIRAMLKRALALLGTPYRWGGTNPESGFDCSGLVGYVFRNTLGIELPRISRDMAQVGELIRDRDALLEGDLVFFSRRGKYVDHVGIYIGDGQFVHAPRTGKDVEVTSLATGYWSQKFLKARRVAAQ